jgi:hypothetical protein
VRVVGRIRRQPHLLGGGAGYMVEVQRYVVPS